MPATVAENWSETAEGDLIGAGFTRAVSFWNAGGPGRTERDGLGECLGQI